MTLEETLNLVKENNRICPRPQKWNQLYELLPNKSRIENGWEPPLPLILSAWWGTSDISKMDRLQEHIKWADQNGAIENIFNFLFSLNEDEWHHSDE